MKTTTLTKTNNERKITRPLATIAQLTHEEWAKLESGVKDRWEIIALLLCEAYSDYYYEDWNGFQSWFVRQRFQFGFRTAKGKMLTLGKLETLRARNSEPIESMPYHKAQMKIRGKQYDWPDDKIRRTTQASVEAARQLTAAAKSRRAEEDMVRNMALKLIDVGYKVLASKLHPDRRGGSEEAMRRLNAAKALLKSRI